IAGFEPWPSATGCSLRPCLSVILAGRDAAPRVLPRPARRKPARLVQVSILVFQSQSLSERGFNDQLEWITNEFLSDRIKNPVEAGRDARELRVREDFEYCLVRGIRLGIDRLRQRLVWLRL